MGEASAIPPFCGSGIDAEALASTAGATMSVFLLKGSFSPNNGQAMAAVPNFV
jgi:hypothetical protein